MDKINMDNNLFNYATSELSQDAFICWLLSFAKQESKDEKLKEVAQALIRKFIEYKINYKKAENKTEIEDSGIDEEHDLIVKNIYKQYKHIDVLVELESEKYIIIEDKTNSSDHDKQLEKYPEKLITELKKQKINIKEEDIYKIYYKTGYQSGFEKNEDGKIRTYKGYLVFGRIELEEFFKSYIDRKIENNVFKYYCDYIDNLFSSSQCKEENKLSLNNRGMINEFYENIIRKIEKEIEKIKKGDCEYGYGYVSNPSGGFDAMWYIPNEYRYTYKKLNDEYKFRPYIQMELSSYFARITLKIEIEELKENIKPRELRNVIWNNDKFVKKLNEVLEKTEVKFEKPGKFGSGRTMTLCLINLYNEDNIDERETKYNAGEINDLFIYIIKNFNIVNSYLNELEGIKILDKN